MEEVGQQLTYWKEDSMNEKVYLASPYTAYANRNEAYGEVLEATKMLTADGIIAFSPIAYCHQMRDLGDSFDFWIKHNFSFIDWAHFFAIYCMPGWYDSIGISVEEEYAKEHGKFMLYLDFPCDAVAISKFKRQLDNIKMVHYGKLWEEN